MSDGHQSVVVREAWKAVIARTPFDLYVSIAWKRYTHLRRGQR
jgi:hypothetical protein